MYVEYYLYNMHCTSYIIDIYNVNTYFSQLLEDEIKKYPEQYFWFHKKWNKKIYK